MDIIDELIAYCKAWEPWARVMGNVCAGDAAQALRSLRAENAELQHELTKGIHTCGPTCRKTPRCAEMADLRAELAECRAHREDELNIAFRLGQTYWQQADSESYAENKRSAATKAKFHALIARKGEEEGDGHAAR